jgi:hypothetical protein
MLCMSWRCVRYVVVAGLCFKVAYRTAVAVAVVDSALGWPPIVVARSTFSA